MEQNLTDIAKAYYSELSDACSLVPDYNKAYNRINFIFINFIDRQVSESSINFSGTFSKTDYLLKSFKASSTLARGVNDTRVRLRNRYNLSASELQASFFYDVKNISEFVELVTGVPVPTELKKFLPHNAPKTRSNSTYLGQYLRAAVVTCDDNYIYCHCDGYNDDNTVRVSYRHENKIFPGDWSYLRHMMYAGAQLNLVNPRVSNTIIYPEIIIFEPDNLINVTTIANCFAPYAESGIVDLFKRFQPQKTSEPIILGNFAGQLLDEAIHQLPDTHTYDQSIREFFKNNALSMVNTEISSHFHDDAKAQKRNIEKAINVDLERQLSVFDSKEGIVEPSFFSEMLGMQGRLDFLQLDFKVIIEQKSGKGGFPQGNFIVPIHKEEHYVQLLLYMLVIRYNYRDIYSKIKDEFHAFLLYSKYKEPLLKLGFAPQLMFRAIKIRNELAFLNIKYTEPDAFKILERITPESLNCKNLHGRLWDEHIKPQLEEVIKPIHNASDIEKAYFFRFLTFIANEHLMAKLGTLAKENSGFAATWHDSLQEKRQAGNIYDRLKLISPAPDNKERITEVTLQFSETEENDMSNFRIGDIVILYPYTPDKEPDARTTMVFRCSIKEITTDTITLLLRSPQTDARIFKYETDKLWAIEHDFMEASFSALYRSMHSFLTAPKTRRELVLNQRNPIVDHTLALKGDYGDFNELMLKVKQAQELFLIIGPPGTGKTSFGLLNTVKEELLEPHGSVLLVSYTNRAIDEICSKLTADGIDFVRIGNEINCAPEYRYSLLSTKVMNAKRLSDIRKLITDTRVFVATTTSINSNIHIFDIRNFSLAIIDEASQILEPHLIGILSAKHHDKPAIKKFVMIGDHKQLPAVVLQPAAKSVVTHPVLHGIGLYDCRLSLFERMLSKYEHNPELTSMLSHQGRMHREIAEFPNQWFYNNKLSEVPLPHQIDTLNAKPKGENGITDLLTTRRVAFIAIDTPKSSISDKVNQDEADVIAATVHQIYQLEKSYGFDANNTIGVIVPYRNQIATVRNTIDRYGIPQLHDITIDTVERFQGSQRDYIIYGFTVQQTYQLDFLAGNVFIDSDEKEIDRKLNVAMTRAKKHLIMVGNPKLLSQNSIFFRLINYMKDKRSFFKVNSQDYVAGDFYVPAL